MRTRTIMKILLFLYSLSLIWLVIFKLNISFEDIRKVREINLIPFHYENVEAGVGLVFEVTQYILAIGATDVTDLITNTLGGLIGIWLSILLMKIKS